uniref:Putative secreted peptide n=1 Tax=Anopheles braziliensis TaxID=58242 RepID=A0A2M3ZU29_9DIPT
MLSALIWTDYLLCSPLLGSAKQKVVCCADSGSIIAQYNGQYRWTRCYRTDQNRCFFRVIRVGFISQQIRYRSIFMPHCWFLSCIFPLVMYAGCFCSNVQSPSHMMAIIIYLGEG